MQLPTLAKIKFNEKNRLRYGDKAIMEIRVSIPTVRFKSHPEWRRTRIIYDIKEGETVVAVQEQAYNWGGYSYSRGVHILPLVPILTGITKKAAIKWKHCKAYYPSFTMQELTYLDGTPWISEEQIKKEEDEYKEKLKQMHKGYYWPEPPVVEAIQQVVEAIPNAVGIEALEDINLDFLDDPLNLQQG